MNKFIVVEDTSFLPLGGIDEVCEFDTLDEAEEYLSTKFCYLEWEHEFHRVLYIIEKV